MKKDNFLFCRKWRHEKTGWLSESVAKHGCQEQRCADLPRSCSRIQESLGRGEWVSTQRKEIAHAISNILPNAHVHVATWIFIQVIWFGFRAANDTAFAIELRQVNVRRKSQTAILFDVYQSYHSKPALELSSLRSCCGIDWAEKICVRCCNEPSCRRRCVIQTASFL